MAKPIKLTKTLIQQMLEEFSEKLLNAKLSDGSISYSKSFTYQDDKDSKVNVIFEPDAYMKMLTLINTFSDEVAWHGVVEREDDKTFVIKDILVYPQEVTGSTVTTDQERYQKWLMYLEDDVFNNLRMQGHSHVNMGVTPSGVDTNFYDSILTQLPEDAYYIFMIYNKKMDYTVKVYDMRTNTLYENKDVEISVRGSFGDFIKDAKEKVVRRVTYAYSGSKPGAASSVTPGANYNTTAQKSSGYQKKSKKKSEKEDQINYTSLCDDDAYEHPSYGYPYFGRDPVDYDEYVFGARSRY